MDVRERIAVGTAELGAVLADLRGHSGLDEWILISTCNRTELYGAGPDLKDLDTTMSATFHDFARSRGATAVADHLYRYADGKAALHLMRVAAGLDALMLGETQVLGQVRTAYRVAQEAGTVGKALHSLFSRALAAGKRVHRETELGRMAVSPATAAIELAHKVFGDLRRRRALVVGAGETATVAALHAHDAGFAELVIANRTRSRAEALARRVGGCVVGLEQLPAALGATDMVIAATAAPAVLVGPEAVRAVTAARNGEPFLLVDMAVPRDITPACAALPGVFLYNIDDLQRMVEGNLRARAREAERAERVVAQEAAAFVNWQASLAVVPAIAALRSKVEDIGHQELAATLARLPALDPRERRAIEAMSAAIVGKILNAPTVRLKELAAGPAGEDAAAWLCELFELKTEPPDSAKPLRAVPAAQA